MKQPYIVGITGGSGSGKTYFLNQLLTQFSADDLCLISQDNYYRPLSEQIKDEEGVYNFDLPDSIDFQLYSQHIADLRASQTVTMKEYTFNNPNVVPKMLTFKPAPIIIVEGIFVLYFQKIAELLDLKVFIDAKEHIKLTRRIVRDRNERGLKLEEVLYQFEKHVMPTYEKYILPFKSDADLVIPNNSKLEKGLDVLTTFLKSKVVQSKEG